MKALQDLFSGLQRAASSVSAAPYWHVDYRKRVVYLSMKGVGAKWSCISCRFKYRCSTWLWNCLIRYCGTWDTHDMVFAQSAIDLSDHNSSIYPEREVSISSNDHELIRLGMFRMLESLPSRSVTDVD